MSCAFTNLMDQITAEEIIVEWHERGPPDLQMREISFEGPTTRKAVAIIGPRRAGKSFFMYDIISNRLSINIENSLFINLEDHRFGIPTIEDIEFLISTYMGLHPKKRADRMYLFLDEIQNVEGWERFVRSIMDRYNVMVFISGSSSKLLSKEIATSLRGRSISYLVMPYSFREFLTAKGTRVSRSPQGKSLAHQNLREYLKYGGFPDVVMEESEMNKRKTLRGYVEVMLFRDVVERHGVKHIKVLKLLMGQMIVSTANSLSLNRFHKFLKSLGIRIDKNSIYDYREHLVDAFGFLELKRLDGSYRTIEQGLHKIYPIDTGYMTDRGMDLDSNMGRFMETCVALELKRRMQNEPDMEMNFWRENGEVDFVISSNGKVKTLIQVCYDLRNRTTLEREVNGLISGFRDLKCDDLLILNWDQEYKIEVEGRSIRIEPLWSWLTGLKPPARE